MIINTINGNWEESAELTSLDSQPGKSIFIYYTISELRHTLRVDITHQYVTSMNPNVQSERRGLICGCVEHEPPASFTAERDDRKLPPNPLSSAPRKWRFTLGTRMEEVLARPAFHGNKHGVIVPTQEIGHLSNATKQALNW